MLRRKKMKPSVSKRVFSRTAKYVNKKNTRAAPMRGGIRL